MSLNNIFRGANNLTQDERDQAYCEREAAQKAELKQRRARVVAIEEEGEYMEVAFTLDSGERVIGCFHLRGWAQAPEALLEEMNDRVRNAKTAHFAG